MGNLLQETAIQSDIQVNKMSKYGRRHICTQILFKWLELPQTVRIYENHRKEVQQTLYGQKVRTPR